MATETFKSYRNKDQAQPARSTGGTRGIRTMDQRRVFEDGGGGDTTTSTRTGLTSHSSGGATSRYRDRNESPSSGVRATSSITNKINKLTLSDDKDDEQLEDDREKTRREDTDTRKHRSRVEDNDGDKEESRENEDEAAAPRKNQKKPGANANTGKRRKEKKNLREKRRSTGVVIMPGQPANQDDEEAKSVARNTAANMDENTGAGAAAAGEIANYQETINQLQEELTLRHKELDTLRSQMDTLSKQNLRLKDENSALLRVVGSLSGTGGGR